MSVSLPNKANSWTLQLCSSFLAVLSLELSEHVTSDKTFKMPDLSTLTTKALQIDALRYVRTQAATSFRVLEKEKEKMQNLLRSMTPSRGTN